MADQEGQGSQQLGTFTNWIDKASPDDTIQAANVALSRIAQLDQTHRDRFVDMVKNDPAVVRLFEDLRTPA